MELRKGKYKKEEVKVLLDQCENEFAEQVLELKARIYELTEENSNLRAKNDLLMQDEMLASQALKDAQKIVKEKERTSKLHYEVCKKSIISFLDNWNDYFDSLLQKYPYYPIIKQMDLLKSEISEIFNKPVDKKSVEKAENLLKKAKNNSGEFNPKSKIEDYIAATSDNGFNLDDVLNPGTLHLEDLCKELGLLDEKD